MGERESLQENHTEWESDMKGMIRACLLVRLREMINIVRIHSATCLLYFLHIARLLSPNFEWQVYNCLGYSNTYAMNGLYGFPIRGEEMAFITRSQFHQACLNGFAKEETGVHQKQRDTSLLESRFTGAIHS